MRRNPVIEFLAKMATLFAAIAIALTFVPGIAVWINTLLRGVYIATSVGALLGIRWFVYRKGFGNRDEQNMWMVLCYANIFVHMFALVTREKSLWSLIPIALGIACLFPLSRFLFENRRNR